MESFISIKDRSTKEKLLFQRPITKTHKFSSMEMRRDQMLNYGLMDGESSPLSLQNISTHNKYMESFGRYLYLLNNFGAFSHLQPAKHTSGKRETSWIVLDRSSGSEARVYRYWTGGVSFVDKININVNIKSRFCQPNR